MKATRNEPRRPTSSQVPDPVIAKVLDRHPGVSAYTIVNRSADRRVEVVVVPNDDGWLGTPAELLVESWRICFESTYEQALQETDPHRAAITGWHSSFTDQPISQPEMDEWAATTVARIADLQPTRIVEIGAGSGMIMRGLLTQKPYLQSYLATDLSTPALDLLNATAQRIDRSDRIRVQEAEALEAACIDVARDLTIVNSVVQYLPSTKHLDHLIREVVARTPDGGHVFLGDIRHADLLPEFASLKVASKTPGLADVEAPARVRAELASNGELCVSPRFFAAVPHRHDRVTAVEVAPRRGNAPNEMTLFRFDVVLHVGCAEVCTEPIESRWAVGNARLAEASQLAHRWGVRPLDERPSMHDAIDPERTWAQAERLGRIARISWSRSHPVGSVDVEWGAAGLPRGHFVLARPVTACSAPPATTGPLLAPLVERQRADELVAAIGHLLDQPTIRFVPSLDDDLPDDKE